MIAPIRPVVLRAVLLLVLCSSQGQAASPDAILAVVRVPSHGASATVIRTEPGRSFLLGCAHAFRAADRSKPIVLDVPVPRGGSARQASITLAAVDYQLDLSLIVLADGPLPYVAPVAPAGHRPGKVILSVGYDRMATPAKAVSVTLLGSSATMTWTRERPGHGRSGGALLDLEAGYLVGVVHGYEVTGQRRGLYVSHAAIVKFLANPVFPSPHGRLQLPPSPLAGEGRGGGSVPQCPT